MNVNWCQAAPRCIRIMVHVAPNAKKTEVTGIFDDALKIRLQAQPIEGKANDALIRYLADRLSVPKSAVSITHGQTSKRKTVEVATQLTVEEVRRILAA